MQADPRLPAYIPEFIFLLNLTYCLMRLLLCISLLLASMYDLNGQTPELREALDLVENKGQWPETVHYGLQLPYGLLQLTSSGFSYFYASPEDLQSIAAKKDDGLPVDSERVTLHNYKVSLVGASDKVIYNKTEKRSHYFNFFMGKDTSTWRGSVPAYGSVMRKEVYPGIDLKLYSRKNAFKYDFIISEGAAPSVIRLRFDGLQPKLLANGDLLLKTAVGELLEKAPYAYQEINGHKVDIPCRYHLEGQDLSFEFPGGYNVALPLVIDPELVFATFSGAGDFSAGYFSFCTTYDKKGNLYAAGTPVRGIWSPPPLWPTTPGVFQPLWNSIYEPMVCINKYSANGSQLLYSTYYGGMGPDDLPHSMIVNNQEEMILAGSTGSFNLPVTPGCFDNAKGPGTDIFIVHFNSMATALVGATYIGGNIGNSVNGIDMFNTFGLNAAHKNKSSPVELALDAADNIWVVSNTSTIDFPVTTNAFQPSYGGGSSDGVVFALNPDCSQMLYGSYIGGSHIDVAYGIQLNSQGSVVICGGTRSSNFPVFANPLLPAPPSGSNDWNGFVSILNPQSGSLLQSTYLGTEADDQAVAIQLNANDQVYVLGRTLGSYPVSPGVFRMNNTDLFIHKLTSDLSTSLLSTRLGNIQGSQSPFFPTGFLVDNCENVYVTGLSSNYQVPLQNMPLTPNAFQATPGNFWFGVLKPGFSGLLFGTYFGRVHDAAQNINGDHTHVGTNRLDPRGILYQSLCVNSNSYPGTSTQSWSQFNQNTVGQDILSFKFAFNLSGVHAAFEMAPGEKDSGCAPYSVSFVNTSSMGMVYAWDFGDGSPISYNPNPIHIYTQEGVYTVSLHAHNDTACITDDTSHMTITVFDPHVPDILTNDTLVCNYAEPLTLKVQLNNPSAHNQFLWQPQAAITGAADRDSVMVNPLLAGTFHVKVWDTIAGYCGFSAEDSIVVNYKPRKLLLHNNDTLLCKGLSLQINAVATPGYTYLWTPSTGVQNTTNLNSLITPVQSDTYTIRAFYPGCADTIATIFIAVDERHAVSFTASPDRICTGERIFFTPVFDTLTVKSLDWQIGDNPGSTAPGKGVWNHAFDIAGKIPVNLTSHSRACPDTSFVDTVYVYAPPYVYLGPDTGICLHGMPVYLENLADAPVVPYSSLWNTGDTTQRLKVISPGSYSLTVRAAPLGCSTTETIEVKKDCYIDIPNVFTPNNDGVNDYFFPRQLLSKKVSAFHMKIFNRWGQVIFETDRADGRGWDGKFNGADQPQGVFVYFIDVVLDEREGEHYQGNVTLLR